MRDGRLQHIIWRHHKYDCRIIEQCHYAEERLHSVSNNEVGHGLELDGGVNEVVYETYEISDPCRIEGNI